MKNIHYPVCLQTTQGQAEVEDAAYTKNSHSVECANLEGFSKLDKKTQMKMKPAPPYFWDSKNVTCRDWKIRYCCENLWGEPGLYNLLEKKAEKTVPGHISTTDVFVDKPTRKTLFEDCRWRDFVRYCTKNLIYIQFFYCNYNISMDHWPWMVQFSWSDTGRNFENDSNIIGRFPKDFVCLFVCFCGHLLLKEIGYP